MVPPIMPETRSLGSVSRRVRSRCNAWNRSSIATSERKIIAVMVRREIPRAELPPGRKLAFARRVRISANVFGSVREA
jgi:hypothetical protein